MQEQKKCDNCGAIMSEGASFCDSCGHGKGTEQSPAPTYRKPKRRKDYSKVIKVSLIVLVIAVIFTAVITGWQKDNVGGSDISESDSTIDSVSFDTETDTEELDSDTEETVGSGASNTHTSFEETETDDIPQTSDTVPPASTTEPPTVETDPPQTDVLYTVDNSKHVYTGYIGGGDCKKLVGKVVCTVVFVSDSTAQWSELSMQVLKTDFDSYRLKLMSAAEKMGVTLDLTISYRDILFDSEVPNSLDSITWTEKAAELLGYDRASIHNAIKGEAKADEAPIVYVVNKTGRSYAYSRPSSSAGYEFAVLYREHTDAFIHELCHVFGAHDFYLPRASAEAAERFLPGSVMNSGNEIDAFTAYLIGWKNGLLENAYGFFEATQHLTRADIEKAQKDDTYTGYVKNYSYSNGVYTGYLNAGIPHGKGKYVSSDGNIYYDGEWDNGQVHGTGTYKWPNGSSYSGGWVYGVMNGTGTYIWSDGTVYEGDWISGHRTGKGTITWSSGNTYTGDFINGEMLGQGVYTFANGDRYEGSFKNNQFNGQGTYYYADGTEKSGTWLSGKYVSE